MDNLSNEIMEVFNASKQQASKEIGTLTKEVKQGYSAIEREQVAESKSFKKSKKEKPNDLAVENTLVEPKKEYKEHLSALCKSLGYKLAGEHEQVIPASYYKALQERVKQSPLEVFKKLNSKENDYILSQLYMAYVHIDEVSKDTLETLLTNLFLTLECEGFTMIGSESVGEVFEVNPKEALTTFILDKPTSSESTIKVERKYGEWIYKGKKLIPQIVSEIGEHGGRKQ